MLQIDNKKINEYDENGRTPLMNAAIVGDYDEVKRLLELGADPDIADRDWGTTKAENYAGRKAKNSEIHRKIEELLVGSNPHLDKKDLGYDVDEEEAYLEELTPENKIPAWVFGYSALTSFIIGIIGMGVELSNDEYKVLLLYFSLSFFLAPALLIYPVFRYVLGEGRAGITAILSALFGYYFQSSIKKKMDKWS